MHLLAHCQSISYSFLKKKTKQNKTCVVKVCSDDVSQLNEGM